MRQAKLALDKEADLVELMRFMRVVHQYLQLKCPAELDLLKRKNMLKVIDPSSDDGSD